LQGKFNFLAISLAVFAGLALGFIATTFIYSENLLRLPGESPLRRMDRVLKLTPAEKVQIGDVMEQTRAKVQQARRDFQLARRKLLIEAYARIRGTLNSEQKLAFDRDFLPPGFQHSVEHPDEPGEAPPPLEPSEGPHPPPF
jgi:hypothetical protein